jgi:hypothetical protein
MELGALGCIFVKRTKRWNEARWAALPSEKLNKGGGHVLQRSLTKLFSLFLSFFFYYTVLILGLTATVHAGRPGLWLLGEKKERKREKRTKRWNEARWAALPSEKLNKGGGHVPGLWLLGVPSNSFRVNKVWKLTSPKLS